jgi:hypothetical protein
MCTFSHITWPVVYLSVPPPLTECAYERCVISDFRREVYDISALLGYYTVYGGVSLLIIWDTLSFPYSGVERIGPVGCPEMSISNYHRALCNKPKECKSHLKSGHYSLLHYSGIVQSLCVELKLHVRCNLKCLLYFMWPYWPVILVASIVVGWILDVLGFDVSWSPPWDISFDISWSSH